MLRKITFSMNFFKHGILVESKSLNPNTGYFPKYNTVDELIFVVTFLYDTRRNIINTFDIFQV